MGKVTIILYSLLPKTLCYIDRRFSIPSCGSLRQIRSNEIADPEAEIVETTFSFPKFWTVPGRFRFFYLGLVY